jgi:hypothetical protein
MNATYGALIFAIVAVVGPLTPQAQTQPASEKPDVVVSGCIMQAQRTGSLADDTGAGVVATPNTAPAEANNAEPVNAYLLTNASAAGTAERERALPKSYTLQGHEQELAKHLGHHVQVTGRLLPPRTPPVAGAKATAPGIERIAVNTVKMLDAKCPAKTP